MKTKPDLSPYFNEVDAERQGWMTEVAENSPDLQKRIQQIYIPLFIPPPPKKGKTVEEAKADFGKAVEMILGEKKVHVDKNL